MKASLVWYALACGMLWACDSSNGTQENPGQDVMEDSSGLAEVDSSVPVGDIGESGEDISAPNDLVDSLPGEVDAPLDVDSTDASEWHGEDVFFAMDIIVTLVPNSDDDFATQYDSVKLQLFEGGIPCSAFGAVASDPAIPLKEMTLSSIASWMMFDLLDFGDTYTVMVRVLRNEAGGERVVAWGCADSIVAPDDVVLTGKTHAQVELQMVVLDTEGSYDYFEEYTLDEATFGPVMTPYLSPLESLLTNPGTLFLGFIDAHLLPTLSGVSDAAYVAFQEELEEAVAAQLLLSMPSPIIADVQSVVAAVLNPRFEGTLELVQEGTDVTASLTDRRVVLTWEINGQPQVWAKPLAEAQEDELPAFAWSGQLFDVTLMILNESGIQTNLGATLGEFLALEVFPVLTGVPTPEDYLNLLFDCTAIAGAVSVETLAGIGLTPEGLYDVCTATLGAIDETILTPLGNASIPVTLIRQGSCVMADSFGEAEDNDLMVEELVQGIWTGTTLSEVAQANFSGTFGAIRIPPAN